MSEIETIFRKTDILKVIKVYKKDIIDKEIDEITNEEIKTYGDEYLAIEVSKYTGVQSIYKHVENAKLSIQLTADPTKIVDAKYNELLAEK